MARNVVQRHKFKLLGFVSNFMYNCYMRSGGWTKTLSLAFKEEHKLWVLETRLLRKTFWPKGHHLTGDWKQNCLLSEDLLDFYCSQISFGWSNQEY